MIEDPWSVRALELDTYLARVGTAVAEPSLAALSRLHEAHVRTFTFDNVDVLLDQHPGVSLTDVQEKFLGRGRGGYCFEHASLFAAVLERLGYVVTRRLGRVEASRTHMTLTVDLNGQKWLCDPGAGMSLLGPIELRDGATAKHGGWSSRLERVLELPGWRLLRQRDSGWQSLHVIDQLPVEPIDVVMGHHFTYTFPNSHFRQGLMLSRYLADKHVTLTDSHVTIRRPGAATEHTPVSADQKRRWLAELAPQLTEQEVVPLLARGPVAKCSTS